MAVSACYTSCGCNRTPFAADWGKNDLLAYASCRAVVICQNQPCCRVKCVLTGHKDRVNSVSWIHTTNNGTSQHAEPEMELLSASTDKTVIVWAADSHGYKAIATLQGHSGVVTVVTGIHTTDDIGTRTLIASASTDSTVKIWERKPDDTPGTFSCIQTIAFGSGFALALSWVLIPGTQVPLLLCGGDDQKLHIFSETRAQDSDPFIAVQTLAGHEDWVRGIDSVATDSGDLLIASCAQDHYIRIWRISPQQTGPDSEPHRIQDLPVEADIQMKETTFSLNHGEMNHYYAVTLESVLQGHENWIYSLRWQPAMHKGGSTSQPLCLLSASMDKTLVLWEADLESGVWLEKMRVGEVGGNNPGFYGGLFSPDGKSVLAHGYQGAFYIWHQQQDSDTWLPGVTVGGHFDSVQDLGWDPEGGEFLLTTSLDQTTRLHGLWKAPDQTQGWYELGRPQVHGYDLQCLSLLSRWQFVSGADEKVSRVFEAPRNVVENLHRLSGLEVSSALEARGAAPEGASVPALGLSNKAVFQDSGAPSSEDRELSAKDNSQYPDIYFSAVQLTAPPTEDNLLQNTLWPETQKLYGHGNEIFTLAANPAGTLLASACKAAKAEHGAIILWDVSSWRQVASLESHSLTVTQMVFSHKGDRLLSVSRDRTWSMFRVSPTSDAEGDGCFHRVAYTDKKTCVHSRIIWAAAWSPDDSYFVTVSRDRKAIVWRSQGTGLSGTTTAYLPHSSLTLPDSVTAVDFSPVRTPDDRYILAFGLENGCIHLHTWTPEASDGFSQVALLGQSMAHHLTVKQLQFRPVTGVVGSKDSDKGHLLLASCGADHSVRIYNIDLTVL